ncbi:MAG: HNH endonuclease [Clostridiales bacterium]|nr:HNH endonuclease [Clostridiales bacterium]
MDFWEKEFGNVEEAEDFAGRKILKSAFGQVNSKYGWDIDHIQPLSKGGTDTDANKQIVHVITNDEKADKTTFIIDDITYQVQKTSKSDKDYWANDYDYSNKKYCIVEIDN